MLNLELLVVVVVPYSHAKGNQLRITLCFYAKSSLFDAF